MLVMTSHGGGQIVIANEVVVTEVVIQGKGIRLAIEPTNSILVDRNEVHDRRVFERSAMNEIAPGCPVG